MNDQSKTDNAGTRRVLGRSLLEKKPYHVRIQEQNFIVYPGVFSPRYFNDTKFFAENVNTRKGERFLEIGSGTGVIAVLAALKGAEVVATDINPLAVENTKENARVHDVGVDIRCGDVFDPIHRGEKFDTIFWNVPFCFTGELALSLPERAVFNSNYASLKKFILESVYYLKSHGRLLIGFSRTLGDINLLQKFMKQAEYKLSLLASVESEAAEQPASFELYQAVRS